MQEIIAGPGECRTDKIDVGSAPLCLQVRSTGPVDDGFQVVWFSSDDCNPSNIMGHGDETTDDTGNFDIQGYKSWQIWDLTADDAAGIKCTS
ncbi:hypothetical protein AB5N19_14401 [Seiridium cardinale]|uniref:Uncharacterized protein n=1 Tax=Seiridium cardinale TaxID=138064 RepID=A0ABR2YA41_9PEZI